MTGFTEKRMDIKGIRSVYHLPVYHETTSIHNMHVNYNDTIEL